MLLFFDKISNSDLPTSVSSRRWGVEGFGFSQAVGSIEKTSKKEIVIEV